MRVTRLGLLALLIGSGLSLISVEPAVAVDNVVLRWNEATLDAIRNTKTSPPIASRALVGGPDCLGKKRKTLRRFRLCG